MLRRLVSQIPLLFGLSIVGTFYKPILSQKFWMLDDHNFLFWYSKSTDGRLQNFFAYLNETNFGEYPLGLRFTPTLNVLFAGRTTIFPNDPKYWFLANFLLVLLTYVAIYSAVKLYLNKKDVIHNDIPSFFAALVGVLSLCNSVGARIFPRLGTGEAYAFLFLSSSLFCIQKVLRDPYKKRYWLYLFFLNGLLIGCKENYIWINILFSLIILYNFKNEGHRIRLRKRIYVFFSTIQFLIILGGFLPAALTVKNDIYGRGTSPTYILESLMSLVFEKYFVFVLTGSILLFAISRNSNNKRSINLLLIISISFLVVDQVYYRGSINDHYLANRVIAFVFIICALVKFILETTRMQGMVTSLIAVILILMIFSSYPKGAQRVNSHFRATVTFSNSVDKIFHSRQEFPQFAFVAQSSWDYESIFSVAKQLRARGDTRKFFLFSSRIPERLRDSTTDSFQIWMKDGVGENLYSPIKFYEKRLKTICAYSQNQNLKLNECDDSELIIWLP